MKTNYKIGFTGMTLVVIGVLLKINQYKFIGEIIIILGLITEGFVIYRFFSKSSKNKLK